MSCNTGGSTQGCNYIVELPNNPVVAYTCANINLTGIGVYDSQNGNEFDFRGITSGNNSLLVTLDAGNNSILLTFNIQQIIDDLPDATTTQRGVLETATDAEAIGKALDNKILTPSNLAAIGATTTFSGLIEIATDAEALAGASTSLAITPANLAYVNAAQLTTVVFADAVARGAAVPAFKGQFGYQQDTDQAYVSYGTAAGEWQQVMCEYGSNTSYFNLQSAGNGGINMVDSFLWVNGAVGSFWLGDGVNATAGLVKATSSLTFENTAFIDFGATSLLKIGAVSIPANSVVITGGAAGNPSSKLINTFISNSNTQTGYTAFANGATLRTCDTATVTLPELAQIVGTLIQDLKAVKLPAS